MEKLPPSDTLSGLFSAYILRHHSPLSVLSENRTNSGDMEPHINSGKVKTDNTVTYAKKALEASNLLRVHLAAFKCLYMAAVSKHDTCHLIKKHHRHIVELVSAKKTAQAIDELSTLRQVFSNSKTWQNSTIWALLEGISPTYNTYPSSLVVAYHFLVIQSVLQYVSSNLQSIACGKLDVSVFYSVACTFLSTSNFQQWLQLLAAEPVIHRKYQNNSIKMLGGFVKVADFLFSKMPSEDLAMYISLLKVKLLETRLRLGEESDAVVPPFSACAAPFVADLRLAMTGLQDTLVLAQLSQKIHDFDIASVSLSANEDIFSVMDSVIASEEHVGKLHQALELLTLAQLQEETFFKGFSKFICDVLVSSSAYACSVVGTILNVFASKLLHLAEPFLPLLDKFVVFAKKILGEPHLFGMFLETSVPHLCKILSRFQQTKRINEVASLCFEFGKASKLPLALRYSVQFSTSCEPKKLRSRTEYSICALVESGGFGDALTLACEYFQSFEVGNYFGKTSTPNVSSSLLRALARCIKNQADPTSLFGGLNENFNVHLFEKLLVPLRNELLNQEFPLHLVDSFTDQTNKLLCMFWSASYFSLSFEVSELCDSPIQHVLTAGVISRRLLRSNKPKKELKSIQKHILMWSQSLDQKSMSYSFELQTFKNVMMFLTYLGHFLFVQTIIRNFSCSEKKVQLNLELLHCECLLLGRQLAGVPNVLANSGTLMKRMMSITESNDVMRWKLLQLNYYIQMKDQDKCIAKFKEIQTFLDSKPEYSLRVDNSLIPLVSKLSSLLVLAHFLLLSSQVNLFSANYVTALKNLKLAIKLLNSILRKLGTGSEFEENRWKTQNLLFASYKSAFGVARHLGLLKEAIHYMNEFKKLNEVCETPIMNALFHFELADYFIYIDKFEDSAVEFAKGKLIAQDSEMIVLQAAQLRSTILNETFKKSSAKEVSDTKSKLIQLLETLNMKEIVFEALSLKILEEDLLYFEYLISMKSTEAPQLFMTEMTPDRRNMLIRALLTTKTEIREVRLNFTKLLQFEQRVSIMPKQNFGNSGERGEECNEAAQRLLECKEIMLRFMEGNYLEFLAVAESHDLYSILNRCLFLLSFVAVLKTESASSLLESIYFLQDWSKHLSWRNLKSLLQVSNLQENPLLPQLNSEPSKKSSLEVQTTLFLKLHNSLPKLWVVVTLDICPITGDLMLSKFKAGDESPMFLKLPLSRSKESQRFASFDQVSEELHQIIDESNKSTKSIVTSLIKTRDDRRSWWKLRFGLDLRLRSLLGDVEKHLIGGFEGVFSGGCHTTPQYVQFKEKLQQIWRSAGKRMDFLELSDGIVELFYNLSPYNGDGMFDFGLVEDLIRYTADELSFLGEFNMDPMFEKIQSLYSTVANVPANSKEHLVLIPSFACSAFPWESLDALRSKSVSRVPSVAMLLELLENHDGMAVFDEDKGNTYYLVNPGKDLTRTQDKFQPILESLPYSTGLCGQKPAEEAMISSLLQSDLFIYLGHGGGEQYMRSSSLLKAKFLCDKKLPPGLLMGCSSGAFQDNGLLEPTGNVTNWLLCGSPMVVTNLWDITDKDIDTFSLSVFDKWGIWPERQNGQNISQAVSSSRDTCTLKYLNGAAPILHGLPLHLR